MPFLFAQVRYESDTDISNTVAVQSSHGVECTMVIYPRAFTEHGAARITMWVASDVVVCTTHSMTSGFLPCSINARSDVQPHQYIRDETLLQQLQLDCTSYHMSFVFIFDTFMNPQFAPHITRTDSLQVQCIMVFSLLFAIESYEQDGRVQDEAYASLKLFVQSRIHSSVFTSCTHFKHKILTYAAKISNRVYASDELLNAGKYTMLGAGLTTMHCLHSSIDHSHYSGCPNDASTHTHRLSQIQAAFSDIAAVISSSDYSFDNLVLSMQICLLSGHRGISNLLSFGGYALDNDESILCKRCSTTITDVSTIADTLCHICPNGGDFICSQCVMDKQSCLECADTNSNTNKVMHMYARQFTIVWSNQRLQLDVEHKAEEADQLQKTNDRLKRENTKLIKEATMQREHQLTTQRIHLDELKQLRKELKTYRRKNKQSVSMVRCDDVQQCVTLTLKQELCELEQQLEHINCMNHNTDRKYVQAKTRAGRRAREVYTITQQMAALDVVLKSELTCGDAELQDSWNKIKELESHDARCTITAQC